MNGLAAEIAETYMVTSTEQAVALLNPLRAEILSGMTEPVSAAEIARSMGETPQKINYHLKALEKVGLVHRVGSRQIRNLVEVLYRAAAKTFVLSESLGLPAEAIQHMKDQGSLAHLITVSERIKKDALRLMQHSDKEEHVPSASLHTRVSLSDEGRRKAFVEEYVQLVRKLTEKYQTEGEADDAYHVLLAVYPDLPEGG